MLPPPPARDDVSVARRLRRVVALVAALNLAYFGVQLSVALSAGSVSLLADSADFLEDTAVNVLVLVALGWPLARRAAIGKVMALVILVPAALAAVEAVPRFADPVAPAVVPVVLASLGAMVVNGACALVLARVHAHGGSLGRAAFLSARNDVLVNAAVVAMALLTAWTGSGWPDLVLGCVVLGLAVHAAREVWELSEEERLAARALAGEALG